MEELKEIEARKQEIQELKEACEPVIEFLKIDCQVKCNKINERTYKALRGEYESQDVYEGDY